jgi:UDP-glucose 4-epimerase
MEDLKGLSGKVVAITGASGYIGSALSKKLTSYPVKIIRISRKKLVPIHGVDDWVMDLTCLSSWNKVVNNVDIIFHLSSNTSIYEAEKNPKNSLDSNLLPIIQLISASKHFANVPKVIFASTATVYGLKTEFPVKESDKTNPLTVYDKHKLLAEEKLIEASNINILNTVILRLANVYGPSVNESKAGDRGVLSKVTRMKFEGKNLILYGDGLSIRDYVYIDDVVDAFIHASIIKNTPLIYNVASGHGTSIKEVFNLISYKVNKLIEVDGIIKNVAWPIEVSEIEKRNFIGSIELLKCNSGWRPKVNLEQGINQLVSHYAKEYIQ